MGKEIDRVLERGPAGTCDPEKLLEEITEAQEKLFEDATDAIDRLASKSFGDFFVTAFQILGKFLETAALSFSSMVASMITASIGGAINTLVGMALNTLVGAEIMFQYLAAKALKVSLQKRLRLGQNLNYEALSIIALLNSLLIKEANRLKDQNGDLAKARKHVKNAALIIGTEISKMQNGSGALQDTTAPISDERLNESIDEINRALRYVSFGQTVNWDKIQKAVNRVTEANGLEVKMEVGPVTGIGSSILPSGGAEAANIAIWTNWLKKVVKEMDQKNLFEEGPGKSDSPVFRIISGILTITGIPDIIKTLIVMSLLRPHISAFSNHMPLAAARIAKLGESAIFSGKGGDDVLSGITDSQYNPNNLLDLVKEAPKSPHRYEKGVTYQSTTSFTKIKEVVVLMLDQWTAQIKKESGLIKQMLNPALNNLNEVDSQIGAVLAGNLEESSEKRFEWQVYLEESKVYINGAKSSGLLMSLAGDSIDINPREIAKAFSKAQETWTSLQSLIESKTFDTQTNERKIEPGTRAYEAAQKYLSIFATGSLFMFDSKIASNSVQGLQSVKILLEEQNRLDVQELRLVNQFINQVEGVPIFGNVIKPSWDIFMEKLEKVSGDLAEKLGVGDLSQLASDITLGASTVTQLVGKINNCLGGSEDSEKLDKVDKDKLSFEMGGSADVTPQDMAELNAEIDQDLSYLKDRSTMLKEIKSQIK